MEPLGGFEETPSRGIFSRMWRNIGWLLGGRGASGIMSLGYLAFAARALGPSDFGIFSLILAYGAAIAGLAQFRSWQAVIRYGQIHLAEGRPDRLARLFGFTATIDGASALICAVLAIASVKGAGYLLDWSAGQQYGAALFTAVLLLSTAGTANGILRLYDRFDLIAYCESTGPAVRLAGAAFVWWAGGGLYALLVVWGLAALMESGAQWLAVITKERTRFSIGRHAFMQAAGENPRIWGFMIHNSVSSSLGLLWQQAGTLAVGAVGGAAAAGGFRVAGKLAGAFTKPAEAFTRVLYPELARLTASGDGHTLRWVMVRTTAGAALVALVMTIVVWAAGPVILDTLYGRAFVFTQPYLMLLTIAAAVDLCGLALEPILNAHGLSGRVLGSRLLGAVVYIAALLVLMPSMGPIGAAAAAVASSIVIRLSLAVSTRKLL